MNDNLPVRIGRYGIDKRIGSGSMGFVYLGHDAQLDRPVAIKTVKDLGLDSATKQMFLERFRNEARAAAKIRHANIVQIYDTGEDELSGPFLVFEYVEGETLKHLLRQGPLTKTRAISLVRQIAAALNEAHRHGIIHRDVKPENVLITRDGVAKLADFGIARLPNAALTDEGQFLGTPCYAAPETLRDGSYGIKTDLFSFGALIYEVVTGKRAFPGDEAIHVANLVLNESPVPPTRANPSGQLPSAVDAMLARGLAKDPAKRFESAVNMSAALEEALSATERSRAVTALLLGAIVVCGAAWAVTRLSGRSTANDGPRTNSPDGATESIIDAGALGAADGATSDASVDAGGADVSDAGISAPHEWLTPHEREEAAKDALGLARRALQSGNNSAARAHLARAAELDPTNPDVDALLKELEDAESDL